MSYPICHKQIHYRPYFGVRGVTRLANKKGGTIQVEAPAAEGREPLRRIPVHCSSGRMQHRCPGYKDSGNVGKGNVVKLLASITWVVVWSFVCVSSVVAQQTPQPVVRTGNFIEVANDVFMHIIATADIRYITAQNLDFESRIRDQATSRSPTNTAQHATEGDLSYAELRLGVDFRYQKNLSFHLLFENQSVFDGNLIDDRSNTSNPGGTDVFGRAASTENPGFRVERYYIRYKFAGTPLLLHVGADLQKWSQAGILGNDNPRIGVEAEFGPLQLWATASIERESQRLGLQNDNDFITYIFGGAYDLKPHRFGFDVVYFRDRFLGADTQAGAEEFRGQKTDSVWIDLSWTGRLGPVRGLLQGNLLTGTARGGTGVGLPAGVPAGRKYDIFAGSVIAYAEVDLGVVRPYVGFIYGTGDDDPRDNKLHGFAVQSVQDSTQFATGMLAHLDVSAATGGTRDYSCPGRMRGVRRAAPAGNPYAVGATVLADEAGGAVAECYHTVGNLWNHRVGVGSHVGITTTYSNPGTLLIPVGVQVFPAKGHQLVGWYTYRAMVDSALVEAAFIRGVDAGFTGRIRKTLYHEVGGFWMWTLNPHFDIRLTGQIGIPGDGTKDLARLADCNPQVAGVQSCSGDDLALKAEARFRARF